MLHAPVRPPVDHPATEIKLPRTAEAAAAARRFIEGHYRDHLGGDALVNAKLVVCELVSNAFVHGAGAIVLRAKLHDDGLAVEVVDDGTGNVPAIREQGRGDGGGWGLRIVDSLALSWGAYEGATHVWAHLPTG